MKQPKALGCMAESTRFSPFLDISLLQDIDTVRQVAERVVPELRDLQVNPVA
jgi:hypothetical protein